MSASAARRLPGVGREEPRGRATVVVRQGGALVATWQHELQRPPDLDLVDEIARLRLAAARLGCELRIRTACPTLAGLLGLVGLEELLDAE